MDEKQAKEEIQLIKTMLDKTKKATAESGTLFIVWSVLIAVALVGNSILAFLKMYDWEWVNWIVVTVAGWVYSVIYGIRRERLEPVRTYIQAAARHLYFSCGTAFLLVGIVFPVLKVYSYEAIPILIAAVSGVLFFVMGGIYEWPLLKWAAALWWAGAIGMSFLKSDGVRLLLFTILFIVAFLVPSFILRAKYRQVRAPQ